MKKNILRGEMTVKQMFNSVPSGESEMFSYIGKVIKI